MPTSPTQLSLRRCRAKGWVAEVVERWNQYANIRQDLFGFIDIVALQGGDTKGVLAIQATTTTNAPARVRKIANTKHARAWLEARNRIEVWGWAKRITRNADGKKSKRKLWTLKTYVISIADVADLDYYV